MPLLSRRSSGARAWLWASLAAALLFVGACGKQDAPPPAGGPPGGAPPPPPVGVMTVKLAPVALQTELPGRVEPVRVAQVRARVTGVVQRRLFREGSDVKAGQVLFRIDPAPYQATVDSAQAQLQRAEAGAGQARVTADRYRPLAQARAIPQQDYANAEALQKAAEADVAAARAAVRTARISLGYAQVTAPIAGRIGRALVTEGALVSAVEATPLALIQQIGSVYVNFTQSAGELQQLRRALAAGQLQRAPGSGEDAVEVHIHLDDGSELPSVGRLLFSDVSIDPGSGQVTLRAEVPNRDGLLLPGQYVRVRLAQAVLPSAVLVPQQAVTRNDRGDTVLVVGEGNKPGPRPVKIAGSRDGRWIVTSGLADGERVIVDGFQKMFAPGAPVTPVPWQANGAASGAAAAGPMAGGSAAAPASAAASSR
ncbi:MAG: efflux RND transporter periplasmic adaptor subunit [Rubrivivax sp.]